MRHFEIDFLFYFDLFLFSNGFFNSLSPFYFFCFVDENLLNCTSGINVFFNSLYFLSTFFVSRLISDLPHSLFQLNSI